jgi:hypothetical protein
MFLVPDPATAQAAGAGGSSAVDAFVMNRYKDEGFVFVGLGKGNPKFKPMNPRISNR